MYINAIDSVWYELWTPTNERVGGRYASEDLAEEASVGYGQYPVLYVRKVEVVNRFSVGCRRVA